MSFSTPITSKPASTRWDTVSDPTRPPDPVTIASAKAALTLADVPEGASARIERAGAEVAALLHGGTDVRDELCRDPPGRPPAGADAPDPARARDAPPPLPRA